MSRAFIVLLMKVTSEPHHLHHDLFTHKHLKHRQTHLENTHTHTHTLPHAHAHTHTRALSASRCPQPLLPRTQMWWRWGPHPITRQRGCVSGCRRMRGVSTALLWPQRRMCFLWAKILPGNPICWLFWMQTASHEFLMKYLTPWSLTGDRDEKFNMNNHLRDQRGSLRHH